MSTKKTSIRLNEKDYLEIKELADHYGQSVTTFMRNTLLERLEDESDYRDAVKSLEQSDGEVVTSKEIMARLGM